MSDLEGWSRIIEGNNHQKVKEAPSKEEIKNKDSTADHIAEQCND